MKKEKKLRGIADFTQGSLFMWLLKISWPSMIALLFQALYNVTDSFYAGKLGKEAISGLTVSTPLFNLTIGFCVGIGVASASLIANAYGEKNARKSIVILNQAYSFTSIVSVSLYIIMAIVSPFILNLFHIGDPQAHKDAIIYTQITLIGVIPMAIAQVSNSALISSGYTTPYRNILIASFLVNLGLDPLFAFGIHVHNLTFFPSLGVAGLALATLLVQIASGIMLVWYVFHYKLLTQINFRLLKPQKKYFLELFIQGLPATINMINMSLGGIIQNYFISPFGVNAVAGYGAAMRIEQLILMPAFSISSSVTAIVGQNNGAKMPDRIKKTVFCAFSFGGIMYILLIFLVVFASKYLILIFIDDKSAIQIGMNYLHIETLTTFPGYIIIFFLSSVLQGMKRPQIIIWLSIYRQIIAGILFFMLMIYVFHVNLNGVWWSIMIKNDSAALFLIPWVIYTFKKVKRIWEYEKLTSIQPKEETQSEIDSS